MAGGCPKDNCRLANSFSSVAVGRHPGYPKLLCIGLLVALLSGCVATTLGIVAGTAVAVGAAAVKVPIKVGGAVIDVVTDDEDQDEDH